MNQYFKQLSLEKGADSIAFVSDNARSPPRTLFRGHLHRDDVLTSSANSYSLTPAYTGRDHSQRSSSPNCLEMADSSPENTLTIPLQQKKPPPNMTMTKCVNQNPIPGGTMNMLEIGVKRRKSKHDRQFKQLNLSPIRKSTSTTIESQLLACRLDWLDLLSNDY